MWRSNCYESCVREIFNETREQYADGTGGDGREIFSMYGVASSGRDIVKISAGDGARPVEGQHEDAAHNQIRTTCADIKP